MICMATPIFAVVIIPLGIIYVSVQVSLGAARSPFLSVLEVVETLLCLLLVTLPLHPGKPGDYLKLNCGISECGSQHMAPYTALQRA